MNWHMIRGMRNNLAAMFLLADFFVEHFKAGGNTVSGTILLCSAIIVLCLPVTIL